MRAWLAAVLALSGCYLQPTVFDSSPSAPTLESAPTPAAPDVPVGCITFEPSYRRRIAGSWWLGNRRVAHEEAERALGTLPMAATWMARARRNRRHGALGLFFGGVAVTVGSLAGMVAWLHADEQSQRPLVMLAPALAGYAFGFAAIPVSIRGDHERRRAIDTIQRRRRVAESLPAD